MFWCCQFLKNRGTLNKLGIEIVRATCQNTISLYRGLFKWTNCTKGNELILLMIVFLYFSYIAIIFFLKSSQVLQLIPLLKADLEAREYLVLYNVMIFPRRGPRIYIKHGYMCAPGVINVLNHATLTDIPGMKLRKVQCILIYSYRTLHSLDKIIWIVKKTSRNILSHVSI
jgi:hypothetical protein